MGVLLSAARQAEIILGCAQPRHLQHWQWQNCVILSSCAATSQHSTMNATLIHTRGIFLLYLFCYVTPTLVTLLCFIIEVHLNQAVRAKMYLPFILWECHFFLQQKPVHGSVDQYETGKVLQISKLHNIFLHCIEPSLNWEVTNPVSILKFLGLPRGSLGVVVVVLAPSAAPCCLISSSYIPLVSCLHTICYQPANSQPSNYTH